MRMRSVVVGWIVIASVLLGSCFGPTTPDPEGEGPGQGDGGSEPPATPPFAYQIDTLVHELRFDDPSNIMANTADGGPAASPVFDGDIPVAVPDRLGVPAKGASIDGQPLALPPSDRNHPSASGMTLSLWVRIDAIEGTAAQVLLSSVFSNSPSGDGWQLLYRPGDDSYVFRMGGEPDDLEFLLPVPEPVVGRWHHVAVVWNQESRLLTLEVNGIYSDTSDIDAAFTYSASTLDLWIGINGNRNYDINGRFDQLRIYSEPLPLEDPAAELDVARLRDEGKRIYFAKNTADAATLYSFALDGTEGSLVAQPAASANGSLRDIEVRPDLGFVYWYNLSTRSIERAPLSGGNVETVFDADQSTAYKSRVAIPLIIGLAINGDGTEIYAGDQNYDGILKIDLDTGDVTSVYKSDGSNITILDVDLDEANNRLYFLEQETDGTDSYALMRVDTTGGNHSILIENAEDTTDPQPSGLALDIANDRLFFVSRPGTTYQMTDLSSTISVTPVGATAGAFGRALAFSPSDDELFLPRESAPPGDMQSVGVESGIVTNYTSVDAGYALDLLVPRE